MDNHKCWHFLGLILCWLSAQCYSASILVIESYHKEYQWDIGYKQALTDSLASEHNFSYFEMNTKRLPVSQYQAKATQAWQYYLKIKPDIVVLGDDNALKFLGPKFAKSNTPIVYLGINNNPRNYGVHDANNITGVLERPLIKRSILSVRQLVPNLNKVLVLFDSGTSSLASLAIEFKNRNTLNFFGITVEVKLIEQSSLWQQEIIDASRNGFDAVVVGLYHSLLDTNGNHFDPELAIKWASSHSSLPLFCLWDFSVASDKSIGGLVLESYQQGLQASNIINLILAGAPPGSIRPQTAINGNFLYSKSQLKRFGLKVPADIAKIAHFVE